MPVQASVSDYKPQGDQPRAIGELTAGRAARRPHQTLLGVTGSGKTFTMANVMAQRAAAHAGHRAQQDAGGAALRRVQGALPRERGRVLRQLLRLLPARGVRPLVGHVHREGLVDQRRDRADAPLGHPLAAHPRRRDHRRLGLLHLRPGHRARRTWRWRCTVKRGDELGRDTLLRRLVEMPVRAQRRSTSTAARSGCAATRSRSSPPTRRSARVRVEFFGDTVEKHHRVRSAARRDAGQAARRSSIFPGSHYVTEAEQRAARDRAPSATSCASGCSELQARRTSWSRRSGWSSARMFDLEMMEQMGFCNGIENYSRHLSGRAPGEPPPCLIDYFPQEPAASSSTRRHQTIPQIGAMYRGDRSRKETLVEYGFRLPSRARQPAAQVRRVGEHGAAGRSSSPPRRPSTSCSKSAGRGGGADHPPHRPDRPGGRGAPGRQPGRRPAGGDPQARRRWASACW